jgi:exopolyphosphatase/guanosine-5'-triphosphate,3'-diphosphate pyrophosphatase
MQKFAIIDMGTNTFLLLIAEKKGPRIETLHQQRIATKIGMGGINDGMITSAAIERAMSALKEFDAKAKQFGVTRAVAIGTSAIRNAKNKKELLTRITSETSFEVNVISGEEEADLIYKGVRQAVTLPASKALIVDIGGGSVEFIIADGNQPWWKQSFEIGGQRLMELFHHHDPILPEEIENINHYLEEKLRPLFLALEEFRPTHLVGSSGSFDTLSEIYCAQNNIPYTDDPETPLTIEAFHSISEELLSKNRAARMQVPGMIELRVDMIVVGCCLIQFLLSHYSFLQLRVSSYSLKEGVMASMV